MQIIFVFGKQINFFPTNNYFDYVNSDELQVITKMKDDISISIQLVDFVFGSIIYYFPKLLISVYLCMWSDDDASGPK